MKQVRPVKGANNHGNHLRFWRIGLLAGHFAVGIHRVYFENNCASTLITPVQAFAAMVLAGGQ